MDRSKGSKAALGGFRARAFAREKPSIRTICSRIMQHTLGVIGALPVTLFIVRAHPP